MWTTYLLSNLLLYNLLSPFPTTALDLYNLDHCYIRFQAPRAGQSTLDAHITTLDWATSVDDVTNTILDFGNNGGNNAQLWLSGFSALLYAGYATSGCIPINPQSGLNADNVAVTVILPSGVAKLQKVNRDPGRLSQTDARATTGIFGIQGRLDPSDYAYTTGGNLKKSLMDWERLLPDEKSIQPSGFMVRKSDQTMAVMLVDWI